MRSAMAPSLRVAALCFSWLLWLPLLSAARQTSSAAPSSSSSILKTFHFTESSYNGTIYENTIGKVYIQTSVRMGIVLDRPSKTDIEYSIVEGNNNIFKAVSDKVKDFCFLRVRTRTGIYGMLNREHNSKFYLKVKAKGFFPGDVTTEAFTNVIVNILDRNEFSPLFPSTPYDISIPEDTPLHKSIGQVQASDADIGSNGQVYYSFVQATQIFAIHPTNGVISLSRPVRFLNKNLYELTVLAQDRGYHPPGRGHSPTSYAYVKIGILPVNLTPPKIEVTTHRSIVEHGNIGSTFAVVTVSDSDHGADGQIGKVEITNDPKDIFRLVDDGQGMYSIEVLTSLDRETLPPDYNVTLEAEDKGDPPKTSTVVIPVKVLDINDFEPEFEQSLYQVEVSEIDPINTPVLFVKANDKDLGSNGDVRYSIVDGNMEHLFSIDEESGLIRTASHLNFEDEPKITLVVQATDQANEGVRKTGQARVMVTVKDYNDHAPVFDMPENVAWIKENLPKDSHVVTIRATDQDSGDNGKISYSLVNMGDVPFKIDAFTGDVTTTQLFDYETSKLNYELHLRASDWGSPFKRETDMVYTIKVKDVNDNSPIFESDKCTGYLTKESTRPLQVVALSAVDFDLSNIVIYSITSGNEDDCFSIVPTTGIVSVNCDTSGYPESKRTLVVEATDGEKISVPPVTVELNLVESKRSQAHEMDEVRVSCRKTDALSNLDKQIAKSREENKVNAPVIIDTQSKPENHAPAISSDVPALLQVSEKAEVGSVIFDFAAFVSDPDSGFDGLLVYVISGGNDHFGHFKLGTTSGKLVVLSPLDYETKSEYRVTLTAMDEGIPQLDASQDVKIAILDENDNAPVFDTPMYSETVSEDAMVNSTLLRVTARDEDSDENSRIRYSILSDDRDFYIEPFTGTIKVKKPLDREAVDHYLLVVQAEDLGQDVKLSSTAKVNVTVTDVNDNAPVFMPSTYFVRLREDLPLGTVVTTLTAKDPDLGLNGKVTYSFTRGMESKFEIDNLTGTIRIKRPLDYEKQQIYNISATAQDGGQPPLKSTCNVVVEVMDVDENRFPPVFDQFVVRGSVAENMPVGSYVMRVQATDRDDASSGVGQVVYSIQDGTGLGRFTIDGNGTIRTSQILDRENTSHYWLTLVAQDRAMVPKFARLEVLIDVDDVNDNIPQSVEPAYYTSVDENSPEIRTVVQIQATDGDFDGGQPLKFSITSGNPQSFFSIDPDTGVISTTRRILDREKQGEHALEVTISDTGEPPLSSTTRVIIKVKDENDNKPVFKDRSQRITVFAQQSRGKNIFVYRALAYDADEGPNAKISYSLRQTSKNSQFVVQRDTGKVFSKKDLVKGKSYDLQIRATDNGLITKKSQMRLRIDVIPPRTTASGHPPRFSQKVYRESITENDPPGQLVLLLPVENKMRIKYRFSIVGGNTDDKFSIQPDHGSIFLAEPVDWEAKSFYNLTVCVTDGFDKDYASVLITLIDINDNEPVFSRKQYLANVSETASLGSPVLRVTATDKDRNKRLLYTIASAASTTSLDKFAIGAKNGVIVVAGALDREDLSRHQLTVMVRDQGVPAKRGFARVEINVLDTNDHKPRFLSQVTTGQVYETAAVGTSVVQVMAVDGDKGSNAELSYQILSGNADNAFSIDPRLGIISVAKELDQSAHPRYPMVVLATDHGKPALSSKTQVDIEVTISKNAPPKFTKATYTVELEEDSPIDTVVALITATSLSTVVYTITDGDPLGFFGVNPNSGVIFTLRGIDYEKVHAFNLTVTATNVISASQSANVVIHIVDVNDNPPEFVRSYYVGNISETAPVGSMVMDTSGNPLVIQATDKDSANNARLFYQILGHDAQRVFSIDSNTGAIRTVAALDYETTPLYNFSVQVHDMGVPKLHALQTASVIVHVIDINDHPPRFTQRVYRAQVLLPTFRDVAVVQLQATDPDTVFTEPLSYSIIGGNEEVGFGIDRQAGVIHVLKENLTEPSYELSVQASDGKYHTITRVFVQVQQPSEAGIKFSKEIYEATITENKATEAQLVVIQPIDVGPGNHVTFTLLNNQKLFSVRPSSGVVSTTGIPLDREEKVAYTLVIKAVESGDVTKSAHAVVKVTVRDENDNPPMFLNLPYRCTVQASAKEGQVIQVVTATDPDIGLNGQLQYSLADTQDGRFGLHPGTREIFVRHIEEPDDNQKLVLKVIAQDRGSPPLTAVAAVHVHIVDSSSPMFEQTVYEASVLENAPPHTPIITVQARSPFGQKLIYSITKGDKYGEFALDFNTAMDNMGPCYLSVVSPLDYEDKDKYELTIRATDIFSGKYAEAVVIVNVEDTNDNRPVFSSLSYTQALSEAAAIGSLVVSLNASDSDSGANALVHYAIAPVAPGNRDAGHFHVNTETGEVVLKKALDHETQADFEFLAVATDSGMPAQSATVTISVKVLDLNDNAPVFTQPSYSTFISDAATRGQLVYKVSALDPDESDAENLFYSIVDGNKDFTFNIDSENGLITLSEQRMPSLDTAYILNVSVSDGVYTNFARVSVGVYNSNNYAPVFEKAVYQVVVSELKAVGVVVLTASAIDEDRGNYGMLTYSILNDAKAKMFAIDADTGQVSTRQTLDREKESILRFTIAATDNGGKMGFANVVVRIGDENDNVPQFLMEDYRANVACDVQVGTSIIKIQAEDLDEGTNAKLLYTLHPGQDTHVMRLFEINAYTGAISSKTPLEDYENQVYQFFVRAGDQGDPPLENHVPVEILVMSRNDTPPVFPEKRRLFFVDENEKVGSIIATVRAKSILKISYSIVPGFTTSSNKPAVFTIDNQGRLRLLRRLDREATTSYRLSVRAQTRTSPPLMDYMEVRIQVRDVNDNPPEFVCNPYHITVPEDVKPQSSIVQLQATDLDLEARPLHFSFGQGMQEMASIFSIAVDSGWITLLSQLDRETKSEYNLTVVVSDSPKNSPRKSVGLKALTSSTSVLITVTDVNDNKPEFDSSEYITAVNEDALPGNVILELVTHDADTSPNADVEYYITDGDPLGQFQIHSTGELFVNKPLDRETRDHYQLRVAASDSTFVTYTTVQVDILDVNDNAPVCDQPFHQMFINEDAARGTPLVHIQASDADAAINTKIGYTLEGDGAEFFIVDKASGLIKTAKYLDRETRPQFTLTAVAEDGGGLSCTTSVLIFIKDVNDNPPVFSPGSLRPSYSILEDAKIHTLLTRIAAIDADTGINSQIAYRLAPKSAETFAIDSESGIISLLTELDREINPSYNLTVIAYNPTKPEMSSEATIVVSVLDVNDNPPEFQQSSYFVRISEAAAVGTVVKQVKATSRDIGINAAMTYSIAAGNDQGKFDINPKTGVVKVVEPLDHEVCREYVLTIMATDQGTPPLTNTAIMSINITDINDNPPRFSQNTYSINVLETMPVGTDVFKVLATDKDSKINAEITYSIIEGNFDNSFIIGPKDGTIQIYVPLDREKTSSYSLVIQAHDSGVPMLVNSAVVSILVLDANDNPPRFSKSLYKGLVQEGRRTGIEILALTVTDDDLAENGPPFIFEIVTGNDNGEFHINSKGVLTTAGKLSKTVQEKYLLTVRAFDSGKPPLHADTEVIVEVVDDSLYPPDVRNLSISIPSCTDSFPGGVIGKVEARDRDPYDKTIFSIVSANSHLFDIHRDDGRLIALTGLDAGKYVINVSVSDGKFTSYGKVTVTVTCTTKEMLDNAVTIRFENMVVEQFYANFKTDFQRVIKHELGVRMNDVEIINAQPSFKDKGEKKKADLNKNRRTKREATSNNNNNNKSNNGDDLDVLFAVKKSADRYYSKRSLKRKVERIKGRIESVLGAKVLEIFADVCTKDSCEIGTCVGKVQFDERSLRPVMANGASYVTAKHHYIKQCVCLEGDCKEQVCGDTTCTANKVCQRNAFGDYTCQCPEGRTGDECDTVIPLCTGSTCPIERPMTFAGKSYAKWMLLYSTKRFTLSFRVRTRQPSAALMYIKGKMDYSILQIDSGNLVYKFEGEGLVRIPVDLSDGQWHTIELDRNGREAELSLDKSYTALGLAPSGQSHLDEDADTEEIYFGAEVDVFPNGYRDVRNGFEGCMEDIRVFNIPLPFSGSNHVARATEFAKVEFHCQDYPAKYTPGGDACSSNPCLNGGRCHFSGLNSHICSCGERYSGINCELDLDPCADNPCTNGGRCEVDPDIPNSYQCHCKDSLIGVRCSYGKFCRPNPCKRGGTCVDGPTAPLCDCQAGYQGLYCDKTADVCHSGPCLNGGVCKNLMNGAYFCNCSVTDFSGKNCETAAIATGRLTTSSSSLLYGILGAVIGICLVVIIVVVCLVWKRHKRRHRPRTFHPGMSESGSDVLLNSMKEKQRCKLSNPDLSVPVASIPSLGAQQPPPVPTRPTSYTPSTHDSLNTLNNLDSVRNYGSAADDLENTGTRGHIPDYYQYLESFSNPSHSNNTHHMLRATPPPHSSRAASETDSIQKAPWEFEYPNILEHYMEGDKKQHDKMAKRMPGVNSPQPSPMSFHGKSRGLNPNADNTSLSSFAPSESEDDLAARIFGRKGYHWDTSDWAPGPSMPNISEIPTNEILDSPASSQPSDDCNANACSYDDNLTTAAIYNHSTSSREHSPLLSSDEQRNQNAMVDSSIYSPTQTGPQQQQQNNTMVRRVPETPDYFDDSEYVGDSEYAENEPYDHDDLPPSYADHPKYEQLMKDLDENYHLPSDLHVHPDHYLPNFSHSAQRLELDPLTEDEYGEPRKAEKKPLNAKLPHGAAAPPGASGFDPQSHPAALRPPKEFMSPGYATDGYGTDQEPPSARTSFIDDMSMSMGGFTSNASCSDISGLCEIEDSEINASDSDDENTPCLHTNEQQTQV